MSRRSRNRPEETLETFAQIPVRVLVSEAFKTMHPRHQMVLVTLAAQYRGRNNGDLALTRKMARHFGIKCEKNRTHGLRELEARGLIVKSNMEKMRLNGLNKSLPTTWALTWKAIDYWEGEELTAVRIPPQTWKDWLPTTIKDTPARSLEGTPTVGVVNGGLRLLQAES